MLNSLFRDNIGAARTIMGREHFDSKSLRKGGLRGYQGFFLALTLVVMMVILLTTQNLTTAVLVIGLITNFLIISSQLTLLGDRHTLEGASKLEDANMQLSRSVMVNPPPSALLDGAGFVPVAEGMVDGPGGDEHAGHPRAKESFTMATTAPPGAGPPAFPNIPDTSAVGTVGPEYPGAIDFGETGRPVVGDEAPALGFVDWDASARDNVPQGNPFDTDRIANPQAAPPCVDDDALALFDGDELNAYQVRSRNNPERVWAGIYRRSALMDRYVREELDERENTRWWGNHEV